MNANGTTRTVRRRAVALRGIVVGIATAVVVLGLVVPSRAATGTEQQFSMISRADLATFEVNYKGAPLVPAGTLAFLSPATAQTEFSEVISRGFSSAPYPGAFALSVPGTVSGASGGQVNVPNYPLYVESDSAFTASPAPVSYGPYQLSARSTSQQSVATAETGAEMAGLWSTSGKASSSSAHLSDAFLTETSAQVDSVTISPGVVVGSMRSSVRVTAVSGEKRIITSSYRPGTITVSGKVFGLQGATLVAGDSTTSLDIGPAARALAAAGIELEFVAEHRTATSIVGACLRVSVPVALPGQPPARVTAVLGQVSAGVVPASAVVGRSAVVPNTDVADPHTTVEGTNSPPAAAVGLPGFDLGGRPRTDASMSVAPSVSAGILDPPGVIAQLVRRLLPDPSSSGLYLILVASALLSLGGSRLFGIVAVAQRFTKRS